MSWVEDADRRALELGATHDADRKTIRVGGLGNGGWMLFAYGYPEHYRIGEDLTCVECATNIMYHTVVHGAPMVPFVDIQASWRAAKRALFNLKAVPPAVHAKSHSRITVHVASYLAMKERVEKFGGFMNEREQLPLKYEDLGPADRQAVDDRLAGKVVL